MDAKKSSTSEVRGPVSAGIIILQWLTYAFWGWTVLSLSILVSLVISTALGTTSADEATPYAIAAVLVLLPISLLCDYFYARYEPVHKAGASMVVMVIHAVIFALFGIASLIAAVFSVVKLGITSGDPKNTYVVLYSALIIAAIYGLTFLRTLNPPALTWLRKAYLGAMAVAVVVLTILGFTGPVAHARATRDDRLVQNNFYNLQSSINAYANDNKALPANLSQIKAQGDTQILIDRKLVEYTPNTKPAQTSSSSVDGVKPSTTLYYQLCTNFAKADDTGVRPYGNDGLGPDGYMPDVSTYGHLAGRVCYKISYTPVN